MAGEYTPYDTGARAEPVKWVKQIGGIWIAGAKNRRRAEDDDFGKVDFDDDEQATIVTVHVEQIDGGWKVVVEHQRDTEKIIVEEVH